MCSQWGTFTVLAGRTELANYSTVSSICFHWDKGQSGDIERQMIQKDILGSFCKDGSLPLSHLRLAISPHKISMTARKVPRCFHENEVKVALYKPAKKCYFEEVKTFGGQIDTHKKIRDWKENSCWHTSGHIFSGGERVKQEAMWKQMNIFWRQYSEVFLWGSSSGVHGLPVQHQK